jgi:hypothetical protein
VSSLDGVSVFFGFVLLNPSEGLLDEDDEEDDDGRLDVLLLPVAKEEEGGDWYGFWW